MDRARRAARRIFKTTLTETGDMRLIPHHRVLFLLLAILAIGAVVAATLREHGSEVLPYQWKVMEIERSFPKNANVMAEDNLDVELLPEDSEAYVFAVETEEKYILSLGRIVGNYYGGDSLMSSSRITIKHVYALPDGDIIVHGTCGARLKVKKRDETNSLSMGRAWITGRRPHFLARIDDYGNLVWVGGISPFELESDGSHTLSVTKNGAVTFAATFQGSVRIGIGTGREVVLRSPLRPGVFLAHFDHGGELVACGEIAQGIGQFRSLRLIENDAYLLRGEHASFRWYIEGEIANEETVGTFVARLKLIPTAMDG